MAAAEPDRVVLKEMEKYRRGRPVGEVNRLLRKGLVDAGFPEAGIAEVGSEAAVAPARSRLGES